MGNDGEQCETNFKKYSHANSKGRAPFGRLPNFRRGFFADAKKQHFPECHFDFLRLLFSESSDMRDDLNWEGGGMNVAERF